jgi:hypothetical protein
VSGWLLSRDIGSWDRVTFTRFMRPGLFKSYMSACLTLNKFTAMGYK